MTQQQAKKIVRFGQLAKYHELLGATSVMETREVTWSELKTLRDGGLLTAGQWYRITDYEATVLSVLEPNARSAGHAFDILVRADSTTQLNEDAYAIHHSGDTYFDNSNLAAWKLKYTLDNVKWSQRPVTVVTANDDHYSFIETGTIEIDGTTYILWTGNNNFCDDWDRHAISEDSEEGTTMYVYYDDGEFSDESVGEIESKSTITGSGKGTITWMKDEFGNELSYDFKNIQFKRFYTTDAKGREGIDSCYMVADPNNPAKDLSADDTDDFIWAYTFSSDREGGTQTDTSLSGGITNNVIGSNNDSLPNNVFYGTSIYSNTFGDYCYNNSIGNKCRNNTIGNNCYSNSIGNYFQRNTIGESFYQNSIGNNVYNNTIGNEFNNNSIGNNCYQNSIGNYFRYNTIGEWFYQNTIGNDCYDNSIGESFYQNSIGNYFNNNSIGNGFDSNSIGNSFQDNSIGNYFQYNTIGNSFGSNTIGNEFNNNSIGNGCNNIKIQKDYVYFIVIENGNQYINITSTKTTSSSQVLRNFTVAQGVNNSNSTKTISHNTTNDTFKTIYQNANSTTTDV